MTAGFGFAGLSAFVLLGVGSRSLSPTQYSSLALTWTAATIYGTVVGITAEQVVTRRIASNSGHKVPTAVARRLGWASAFALVIVPLSLLPGANRFADPTVYAVALAAVAVSWVPLAVIRGQLAGRQRFHAYAATLGVEALVRIVLAGCALASVEYAGPILAAAVCLPLMAGAVTGAMLRRPRPNQADAPGPASSAAEQASMAAVALLQQFCLSSAPLWLHWLSEDPGASGRFVSVLTYMRIPMVLSTGLVTIVLSGASKAFAQRGGPGLVKWTLFGLASTAGFVGGAVLLLLAASPRLLPLLFGEDPSGGDTALLWWAGASTVAAVGAIMLVQIVYGASQARGAFLALVPAALATGIGFLAVGPSAVGLAAAMALGQLLAIAALVLVLALVVNRHPPRESR
jgi:O-antigen/teichoic acid export membrane protein